MTLAQLWAAYKSEGGTDLRNQLIAHYSSMVSYVAGRVARRCSTPGVEMEDLFAYGIEALIGAIDKFDPSLGWQFETYAMGRVEGGIVDALRTEDWVPSRVRRDAVAIQRGLGHLAGALGRTPTATELAAHLAVTPAQLRRMVQDASECHGRSMDDLHCDGIVTDPHGEETGRHRQRHVRDAVAGAGDEPEAVLELEEFVDRILVGIQALSDQHRVVLALVHREQLSGEEISALLGIRPTRVSQIHTAAVQALRDTLVPAPA